MLQTSYVIEIVRGKIFGKVTTLYIRKVRAVSLKIIKQGILRCFLSVQVSTELWKKAQKSYGSIHLGLVIL